MNSRGRVYLSTLLLRSTNRYLNWSGHFYILALVKPIISIKEARELLGENFSHFSDKQVEKLIGDLHFIAKLSLEQSVNRRIHMNNHILPFLTTNKAMFEDIKSGRKSIETRAGNADYRKIKPGDTLTFTCGKDRLVKEVKEVMYFDSLDDMFEELELNDIMPRVGSINEAKDIYYQFSGYRERLERDGVIAFIL